MGAFMGTTDGARVLVVDDHEPNRLLLARLLASLDCVIDMAAEGRAALAHLESQPCDLVLLDIMMPVLDGYETLRLLKADDRLRHLPVVVISAVGDMESVARCLEAGADDYLVKPFNPTLLRARVTGCIEKKRLRDREQAHLQALQGQLHLGRRIQADFLPATLPAVHGWEIGARFQPAEEVAGDLYDVFELHGRRLAFVVADVCDKGFGAALFMALLRTLLRVYPEHARPYNPATVGEQGLGRPTLGALTAIERTNEYVMAHHARTNMFASVFFGLLETESNRFLYVNAGHEPPLHVGIGGIKGRLTRTGSVVGAVAGVRYEWREVALERGDTIFIYTDGITEARDPAGAFYSEKRLVERVEGLASAGTGATALLEAIEKDVNDHVAGAEPSDDITMLALSWLK
jgi:serine phosphatase RsbU (regulator of sigma subunit)